MLFRAANFRTTIAFATASLARAFRSPDCALTVSPMRGRPRPSSLYTFRATCDVATAWLGVATHGLQRVRRI